MKDLIVEYIKRNGNTSFIDLEKLFKRHGIKYEGDYVYSIEKDNHVFWLGWDYEYFKMLIELKKDGIIEMKYTDPITYYLDGKVLRLPVSKSTRSKKNITLDAGYIFIYWRSLIWKVYKSKSLKEGTGRKIKRHKIFMIVLISFLENIQSMILK